VKVVKKSKFLVIKTRNNTNINNFLSMYDLSVKGDSVVRTSYYKYLHPKECFIEDSKVHPELLRTIKNIPKKKKIVINDDLLDDNEENKQDEYNLKFVYPFGCSIDFVANSKKNVSLLFNSGTIAYPANRPLAACVSVNKGKLLVIGSEKFVDDEYFEKEENKKIMVIIFLIYM
jgi:intraflagellar transport protein 52